jgi:hypothetical protein
MTYLKLLPPLLGVILVSIISALSDGSISTLEWFQICIAITQTFAVGLAGLLPAGLVWPKTALAGVLAGLQLIVTYLAAGASLSHITLAEWLNVLLTVAVVGGVAVIPPRSAPAINAAPPNHAA